MATGDNWRKGRHQSQRINLVFSVSRNWWSSKRIRGISR